jgi:hypothetical protein
MGYVPQICHSDSGSASRRSWRASYSYRLSLQQTSLWVIDSNTALSHCGLSYGKLDLFSSAATIRAHIIHDCVWRAQAGAEIAARTKS